MTIKEFKDKYNLEVEDYWQHKQSGQWIIKHSAVEKIMAQEEIEVIDLDIINSEVDFCRIKVTVGNKEGVQVVTIGEAYPKNCVVPYAGAMAEKRGIDRGVLKLIHAYEYGISSEVEADDFKKPVTKFYKKSEDEKLEFDALVHHPYFKGKIDEMTGRFKKANSMAQVDELFHLMKRRIELEDHKKHSKESEVK